MVSTEFIEAAQRGYDFLATQGKQWDFEVSRLNPDTLELSTASNCAIAQAAGVHYWAAIERLAEQGFPVTDNDMAYDLETFAEFPARCTFLWERRHGFRLIGHEEGGYAGLTEAWREVIKRARDEEPAA